MPTLAAIVPRVDKPVPSLMRAHISGRPRDVSLALPGAISFAAERLPLLPGKVRFGDARTGGLRVLGHFLP